MSQWEKIYGVRAVEASLCHHPKRVKQLWLAGGRHDPWTQVLTESVVGFRTSVGQRDRRELDEWAKGVHQDVVAEANPSQVWGESMLEGPPERGESAPLLLVLGGVTDPYNLGVRLRTADAVKVQAMIVPKNKFTTLDAAVRKVACGTAEVIPLVAMINPAHTLEKLQQRGLWVAGIVGEVDKTLYQPDLVEPIVLMMGVGGKGMRRLTHEYCNFLARLPIAGSINSLNVSVVIGVCLFEILRQRTPLERVRAESLRRDPAPFHPLYKYSLIFLTLPVALLQNVALRRASKRLFASPPGKPRRHSPLV